MQFRKRRNPQSTSLAGSMGPMIDVVFLLLIFFILTLRILAPEGELQVDMPAKADVPVPVAEHPPAEIRIRLVANADGSLNRLQLGRRDLGSNDRAFARLDRELYAILGRPRALTAGTQIVIDSDYRLNYEHVVRTMGIASGRIDSGTGRVIRYDVPINFAPSRRMNGG